MQILPAMWIWLAMFDLKGHTLHGKSFNVLRGPILIPLRSSPTGVVYKDGVKVTDDEDTAQDERVAA